ncbi:MAG: shikimate kinase [Deltaproteobacteria bacterium]|nr:shikimate kinase [Deltaproteobacteria bacterium]
MSTSAPSRNEVVESLLALVDPRLQAEVRAEFERARQARRLLDLGPGSPVVIVGHRTAGKTRALPLVCALTGRPGYDLDREIEVRHPRSLRAWVQLDPNGFRAAERRVFGQLPRASVISVGGGFLALHADLLEGCTPVIVPISFATYRERLLGDQSRPRLRPELTVEDEIVEIFHSREALHRQFPTVSLAAFAASQLFFG